MIINEGDALGPYAEDGFCRHADWEDGGYENAEENIFGEYCLWVTDISVSTPESATITEGDVLTLNYESSSERLHCRKVNSFNTYGFSEFLPPNRLSFIDYSPLVISKVYDNDYFSGMTNQRIVNYDLGGDFSDVNFQFSNTETLISIIDNDPVPSITFSGENQIVEGESLSLTVGIDSKLDDGFVLSFTSNRNDVIAPPGIEVVGEITFEDEGGFVLLDYKTRVPAFTLNGDTINNIENTGHRDLVISAELSKDNTIFATAEHTIRVLDDEYEETIEEELGFECPMTANPVNIRSGNKYLRHVDAEFTSDGRYYQVIRHYNSMSEGWSFEFERHLKLNVGEVKVVQRDGKIIGFSESAGVYTSNIATLVRLTVIDGNYVVNLPDGSTERYNLEGKPLSIIKRDGSGLNYTYEPSKMKVSDLKGNLLYTISYVANARVETINTLDGEVISYTYSGNNLTSVANSNGLDRAYSLDSQNNRHTLV
jgi:hypothetical protein